MRRVMKRRVCLLGILACIMIPALSVRADVIFEPRNSFYQTHAEECTYISRYFTANDPDGQVTVYKSPESPGVIVTLENGTEIYISYTYQGKDGIEWGFYYNNDSEAGWIPMDYLQVIYDHISFQEEYGGEITEQTGSLGEEYKGKDICFWSYPGSRECIVRTMDWQGMPEYIKVYTDKKGYNWGFVGYYYGTKDSWVCIDQPEADYEELYPDGYPQTGTRAEDGNPGGQASRIVPKMNPWTILITAVLVTAVAAVTAGLLVRLKKKG